jgi:putative ubiquitin-RnfH superfamily antitoxin RatB of RatAB toxin-antitoxin module
MDPADGAGDLCVRVVYCPRPGVIDEVALTLPPGATVADALAASALAARHPGLVLAAHRVGVWGHVHPPTRPLRDGDRVEVYRPLIVDPKEARRERHRLQRRQAAAASSLSGSRSR